MTTKRTQHDTPSGTRPSPRRDGVGFCLLLALIVMLLVLLVLPACTSRSAYSDKNDQLRAERLQLNKQIDQLQQQLTLREQELAATRNQIDDNAQPVEGADPPRLAGIVLGLYSGPIDLDGDKKYDELRVYVRPIDQHSRQITADAAASVRLIANTADGESVKLVDIAYGKEIFHAAYRSGVTGTHYLLAADLPDDLPNQATLQVILTDAATGRRFMTQKQVTLLRNQE